MGYDVTRSRVVLFGGRADPVINNKVVSTYFRDTWEWDGLNWTQVSDVGPNPRLRPGFAFDYIRGRLILFGVSDENTKLHRDIWEWNGEDWTQLSDEGPESCPLARHDERHRTEASRPLWRRNPQLCAVG